MRSGACLTALLVLLATSANGMAAEKPLDLELAASPARPMDLAFAERPRWIERIDRISRNGIPFLTLRKGERSNLVLGIDNNGYFGVHAEMSGR